MLNIQRVERQNSPIHMSVLQHQHDFYLHIKENLHQKIIEIRVRRKQKYNKWNVAHQHEKVTLRK